MYDLIRRSDAIRVANGIPELIENQCFGEGEAERMMKEIPAVDATSLGALEQFKWERDTAIAQLAELGIGFGQKKPDMVEVVRCGDCKRHYDSKFGYVVCVWFNKTVREDGYCNFGCKMDVTVDNIE